MSRKQFDPVQVFKIIFLNSMVRVNRMLTQLTIFIITGPQGFCFYAPAIYNGGHIASPLSVRPYIRMYVPYVQKMVSVQYLLNTLVYWIHISYTGI